MIVNFFFFFISSTFGGGGGGGEIEFLPLLPVGERSFFFLLLFSSLLTR